MALPSNEYCWLVPPLFPPWDEKVWLSACKTPLLQMAVTLLLKVGGGLAQAGQAARCWQLGGTHPTTGGWRAQGRVGGAGLDKWGWVLGVGLAWDMASSRSAMTTVAALSMPQMTGPHRPKKQLSCYADNYSKTACISESLCFSRQNQHAWL